MSEVEFRRPERLFAEPSQHIGEYTATAENITEFDEEYVRADLFDAQAETIAALVEALEQIAEFRIMCASDVASIALRNYRAAIAEVKET